MLAKTIFSAALLFGFRVQNGIAAPTEQGLATRDVQCDDISKYTVDVSGFEIECNPILESSDILQSGSWTIRSVTRRELPASFTPNT